MAVVAADSVVSVFSSPLPQPVMINAANRAAPTRILIEVLVGLVIMINCFRP